MTAPHARPLIVCVNEREQMLVPTDGLDEYGWDATHSGLLFVASTMYTQIVYDISSYSIFRIDWILQSHDSAS